MSVWKYLPFVVVVVVVVAVVVVVVCVFGGSCLPDMSSFLFGVGIWRLTADCSSLG